MSQITLTASPLNTEPPPAALVAALITPTALVFNRNHGEFLNFSHSDFVLSLDADPSLPFPPPTTHSLSDIREGYAPSEVVAVLQCAGNRRAEMAEKKEVEGLLWDRGAIANVKWRGTSPSCSPRGPGERRLPRGHAGALLRDVIAKWGVDLANVDADGLHCHFESSQGCQEDGYYGSSVPLNVALDARTPILLAYEMNGEPLSESHGAPLRVVIPGVIGARSVKWLQKVSIQPFESTNFYQQLDYKVLPPQATPETKIALMRDLPSLLEYDLNCAICEPAPSSVLSRTQPSIVRGYAFGSQGKPITAVELAVLPGHFDANSATKAADDQARWIPTNLLASHSGKVKSGDERREWGWTIWEVEVPAELLGSADSEGVTFVARCVEEGGRVQPRLTEWNLRGVAEQSWSVVFAFVGI